MKSKLTILLAVLLLAVLAMPQFAEAQGWNVSRPADVATVTFGGDNQQVSPIDFNYESEASEDVVIRKRTTGDTAVTVTYGDLMITSRTRDSQGGLTVDGKLLLITLTCGVSPQLYRKVTPKFL